MSVEDPAPTGEAEHDADPDARRQPDEPTRRYVARMRKLRTRYAAVLSALALAVAAVAAVAWSRGEITHTTLHTAANPAPTVPYATPAASVRLAWRTTDHAATGTPYVGGTIVSFDAHSVRGRDGRTGDVTWTYSRSDRTVCTTAVQNGVAVAIYRLHGDCNEVTALDAQTGVRRWTRTLDEDTQTVLGTPAVEATDAGVLVTAPSVIYELDPVSGYDRWVYSPDNCTIHRAVPGSNGVLISQTCTSAVQCPTPSLCGPGPQLLLRDGNLGHDSSSGAKNPDRIIWIHLGSNALPLSAGAVITALTSNGAVDAFVGPKGTASPLALNPVPPSNMAATFAANPASIATVGTASDQLLFLGSTTYRIGSVGGPRQLWSAATTGAPTVTSPPIVVGPQLPSELVAATGSGGTIQLLDPQLGRPVRTYSVGAIAGSLVYPFGPGFIAAGTTTACYLP